MLIPMTSKAGGWGGGMFLFFYCELLRNPIKTNKVYIRALAGQDDSCHKSK